MSFASKYNNEKKFTYDTEGFEYFNLKDLFENDGEGVIYPFWGFYINNKSNYDPYPVAFTDSFFVNLPTHMLKVCEEILKDDADIASINEGKVGFKIYTYYSERHKKDCYSIKFVDLEPGKKDKKAK